MYGHDGDPEARIEDYLQKDRLNTKSARFNIEPYKNIQADDPTGAGLLSQGINKMINEKDKEDQEEILKEVEGKLTTTDKAKGSDKTRINFNKGACL